MNVPPNPDLASRFGASLAERYRIERELGAGGMATVYLAEDVRHQRRVAIKILHAELAAVIGAERFLGEIRTIANLQHPHILGLIDSGEVGGVPFYVMPFVEGESLRERLNRERQLPVEDALRLAREVASALDYAHRHGIVHRDVKPENILLQDGSALVADFGIALAVSTAGGERLTQTGLSLGTPSYMAPEQAMGERNIDARADVYALGAVLYEMLAGEPPFTGPSAQAVVAKVITERPRAVTGQRASVPEHLALAVHRALEKLPADRFTSAAEMARALSGEGTTPSRAASARPAPRSRVAMGAAAVLVLLTGAGIGVVASRVLGERAAPPPPSRLALITPTLGGTGFAATRRQLALTSDGSAVVFVATNARNFNHLAVQRLEDPGPALLEGGDGMLNPNVSLDGRWILAHRGGNFDTELMMRLPIGGGAPTMVYPRGVGHAAIAPDGTVWLSPQFEGGVMRVGTGGDTTVVLPPPSGMQVQQVLEEGRHLLLVRRPLGTASGPIVLLDVESKEQTQPLDIAVVEVRHAAGHLVYLTPDGNLWAVAFDARRKRTTGRPAQLATGVSTTGTGFAQFAVARNGTVAYIPEEPRSLVFVDRNGAVRLATELRRSFHGPQFSPDGRRIAMDFTSSDGRDVWVLDIAQGTMTRATFTRDGHDAMWTPDGNAITFASFTRDAVFGLYRTRPGSGAPPESLLVSKNLAFTGEWLADGSAIVTAALDLAPQSSGDVGLIENGGRGPITPIVVNAFQTIYPALSPDGRWLAFVSNQSGTLEVYVRPLRGDGEQIQVSQRGGTEPVWAPSGTELYYRADVGDQHELIAATLRLTPRLEVSGRRPLFSMADMLGTAPHANYDVSPDGKMFVMVRRNPATRIMILQNFPELVRRAGSAAAPAP